MPSGWNDDPVGVSASIPYEWVSKRTKKDGIWGAFSTPEPWANHSFNAISADLDNQMDNAALDENGKTVDEVSITTTASMWNGATKLSLSSISVQSVTGVTSSYDLSTGDITLSVAKGTALADRTEISITVKAMADGVEQSRVLKFTLAGVRGGKNAVLYSLVTSASNIVKKKDGTYSVSGISATRMKTVGGVSEVTTDGTLKYAIDNGSEISTSNGASIPSSSISSKIIFSFYDAKGVLVDIESVPMIQDGVDGQGYTQMGQFKTGMVVPKMGVVSMGGGSYVAKASTTNPPLWCWTDNAGNRFTYNDGGYCLTGEINTDEYELLVQSGKDGSDGTSYERVFIHTTTESKPATPSTSQTDDYVPSGWHDDPVGVSSSLPYEWISEREKKNGIWSKFSAPALWAKYGFDGADGAEGVAGTSIIWKGDFSSAPSNPQNGWAYKNTTDKKSYVYQDGQWYQMTIDGIDGKNGKDGLSIVWKGDLQTPPSNPQTNWAYRDTNNGRVYIWNGTAWALMVVDGSDGADGAAGSDGLSVFITYNDSTSQPSVPTGNGTTGGWHTNATSTAIWMSQKVAASASDGAWGTPIKIKGDKGDGYTQMGQFRTGMVVPKMGVVSMGGGSYVAKVSTTNPPLWCWTDNAGNRFTYNDGGYVLTGEINTDEYDVWAEKGEPGKDGVDGKPGEDGKDGKDGVQGIQGCIIRSSEWKTGVTYRNDESLTSGTRYIDIVAKKNTSPSSLYGWDMYMCKSTHTSSSSNGPGNTTYWTAVNEMAPIFTSLIIAKNASIDFVQGNELIIKDSNNNVVAGLTGGSSKEAGTTPVRIWAGGNVPGNAPFRVDQNGNLVATKANITGTITATGGVIGPFSIASGMLSSKTLYENETNKYVGFNLSAGQIEFYNERTFANVRIGGNTQFVTIEGIKYDAGIDIQSPNAMIGMHIKTQSIPLFVEGGNIFLHPNNDSYVSLRGIVGNWRNISVSTSLNNNDDNVMFINTGNIEVTLPPDVPGHTIYFKRMSGGVRLTGGRILPAPGGQEVSYIDLDFASGFIKCMGNYWVMFYCG